jgi:hypothetical protein
MIFGERSDSKRLAARVYTTDCLSTLMFKSPPQITAAEMSGDLPGPDVLFEASTADEFSQAATSSQFLNSQSRSLKDLLTLFLDADWSGPESPSLTFVGTEQLMMLIFGQP